MVNVAKIKALAKEKGVSITFLCQKVGQGAWYLNDVSRGKAPMPSDRLKTIADILGTTPEYLCDENDQKENVVSEIVTLNQQKVRLVPLFETVSAGFGAFASNHITDYIPCYIDSDSEARETIAIKVQGDSMFPKIEPGDTIIVHKQDSVDSGSVAVVLLDGEEGLVKKVVYGADWIELHSFNPMYPVRRFEGPQVLRLRVVGLVQKVIKDL